MVRSSPRRRRPAPRVPRAAAALAFALALVASPARAADSAAADSAAAARLAVGVAQLRHAAGAWDVTTSFLQPDGSVARAVEGTYRFDWVVPDRLLSGRSEIPDLRRSSGLLFYVRPDSAIIQMVSVGADGQLWIMTGPVDGEVRGTPDVAMPDGSVMRLRFARSAVTPDGFESRMEYSTDRGATWAPGNHQRFRRRKADG